MVENEMHFRKCHFAFCLTYVKMLYILHLRQCRTKSRDLCAGLSTYTNSCWREKGQRAVVEEAING
jgi:hypothetical protein